MRRLTLVLGVLALAGCGNVRDMFTAHADTAAKAGDAELSSERLAKILTSGKAARVNRDAADFVTDVWVDYTLFAQAVAKHQLLTDSATIAAAMWPDITELRASHWHDTLLARRGQFTAASADSLYRGNDIRVLQHILFRTPQTATPEQRAAARKDAEATLAKVRGGGDFGQLALKLSQDPGSAADSGYLPAAPRGQYVPAFDSAGWRLQPGQVSGLVETPYGIHIIRRPPEEAARGRLLDFLRQNAGQRLDSLYMDSLATAHGLKVEKGAGAAVRAALADPIEAHRSTKKLVSFKQGAALTVGEFMRWVDALPPQYRAQLKAMPDSSADQFARVVAQNTLLVREADTHKIGLSPVEWQAMVQGFRGQVDTLRMEMGIAGHDISDSTISEAERLKVANLKVEQYFDQLVAGQVRLRRLPATLGSVLRERNEWKIYPAGIGQAVELAQGIQAKADSARGKGPTGSFNPGQGGPMAPAPGPAPTPGQAQPAPPQPAQPQSH